MDAHRYVVVTGAKNENKYIRLTIESVVAQTHLPAVWVIFDDGSSDNTPDIVEEATHQYPWIRLIRGDVGTSRQPGFAAVNALARAAAGFDDVPYEYLCIVDADVMFGPKYFETLFGHFEENPELGIAGGQSYERHSGGTLRRHRADPELTAGVVKTYRGECFRSIGGLVRHAGWEALDCYKAMMLGWKTDTFQEEQLRIIHLRPTGSSDRSVYRGRRQRGAAMYFTGTHPLWTLASAIYHIADKPYVLGSLCIVAGYIEALLGRIPRVDDEQLVRFVRRRQLKRIRQICHLG